MSSKSFFGPKTLLSGGVMTGTNKISSAPIDLLTMTGCAFQASWTGTPTGTFIVEGSIDGVTYSDIGAGITTNPAGSAGSMLVNNVNMHFRYCRLSYTNATGVGSLTVLGTAKLGA